MYRGYVRTKNKECIDKFKGVADLLTYEQVKDLDEFAGIIADDFMLVDVDNMHDAEIIFRIVKDKQLKCKVYQSRSGMHFVFKHNGYKKCWTRETLGIGLVSDGKLGNHNSYEVLKIDGLERPVLYDAEEYEPCPRWLTPIKTKHDFVHLTPGDRNNTYFTYILDLQKYSYSKEEARECIRIIDKYIVSCPIGERDLDVILRDDAFSQENFFENGKFRHDLFGNYMVSECNIKLINGQIHTYHDGVYIPGEQIVERAIVNKIPTLKRNLRKEVLEYIKCSIPQYNGNAAPQYICFTNGILDIESGNLMKFDPRIVITNKIPWAYNPAAYNKLVDDTLNKLACGDQQIRNLLEELCGSCLYRRNEWGKAFFLLGDGANGKSTFIYMVEQMLGKENTASLDLKDFSTSFRPAELVGKLSNCGDDISDEFVMDASVFKKLCTGDAITVERKGKDPVVFSSYAKLIFSANNLPKIHDKTMGIMRRMVVIPFNAVFTNNESDYDPFIKDKLTTNNAMEYLINLSVTALKRVIHNRRFTESSVVNEALKQYEKENNNLMLFVEEVGENKILNESRDDVYHRYVSWCVQYGSKPLASVGFSKMLNKTLGTKLVTHSIDGERVKIYER